MFVLHGMQLGRHMVANQIFNRQLAVIGRGFNREGVARNINRLKIIQPAGVVVVKVTHQNCDVAHAAFEQVVAQPWHPRAGVQDDGPAHNFKFDARRVPAEFQKIRIGARNTAAHTPEFNPQTDLPSQWLAPTRFLRPYACRSLTSSHTKEIIGYVQALKLSMALESECRTDHHTYDAMHMTNHSTVNAALACNVL